MKKMEYILVAVSALIIFVIEFFIKGHSDGSIMPTLLILTGVAQGAVVLVAAAELSQGKWLEKYRPVLMQFYPLQLLAPFAFLFFALHGVHLYQWSEHPTAWLSADFFIMRNVALLLLTFVLAWIFVNAVKKNSSKRGVLAVLYILSFVITQTIISMDWVMSFSYPWINTMFGGFFFIEALFAGVAFSMIIAAILDMQNKDNFESTMTDLAKFMIGLALFWAGIFYAQYLTIWYGNLPEEVSWIYIREKNPLLYNLGVISLIGVFLVPFLGLIPKKVKTIPLYVMAVSLFVLAGLFIEKLFFLMPDVHLDPVYVILEGLVLLIPFIYLAWYVVKNHGANEAMF